LLLRTSNHSWRNLLAHSRTHIQQQQARPRPAVRAPPDISKCISSTPSCKEIAEQLRCASRKTWAS